jgi:hypothetical protein
MLLRRCSSLNSIRLSFFFWQFYKFIIVFSAQLILQRLKNVDLSTVNLDMLINQCPEIPVIYLKVRFYCKISYSRFSFRRFCRICTKVLKRFHVNYSVFLKLDK